MATKMSSSNFYSTGKYGSGAATSIPTTMDVTPDLHLKMSKKIAQLTKVIYALNTKNDEHEALVNQLKSAHESELQQLMAETKTKVAVYKSKVSGETELRKRIESLEACILEHERQRKEALEQFTDYKNQVIQSETKLKAEQSHKLLSLSKEVLEVKKDFEERLKSFESMKDRFEKDKEASLEELRRAHAKKVDELLKAQLQEKSGTLNEKNQIEENYSKQIAALNSEYERLKAEKNNMAKDYELKIQKAQAFYEKEMAVMRGLEEKERAKQLKENEALLKRQFGEKEHSLNLKIEDANSQLLCVEEELSSYKSRLNDAELALKQNTGDSEYMTKQLTKSKEELANAVTKLKEIEVQLAASKERCQQQAADMVKKSSMIGSLQATQMSNEATIVDLQTELGKLNDKLTWLEKERKNLESSKHSLSEQQSAQVRSLEKALEDLSIEKQTMKERYEKALATAESGSKNSLEKVKKDFENQLEELQRKHKDEVNKREQEAEQELKKLKEELESKLEETASRLTQERDAMLAEFKTTRATLDAQLQASEKECQRLQAIVDQGEQGLGSANSEIDTLTKDNVKLKSDLDAAKSQLKNARNKSQQLQTELDRLRKVHESNLLKAREDLKKQLDSMSAKLDEKWTDTLRRECEKLKGELIEQHEEDKKSALSQLTLMKGQELEAMKEAWQQKVNDLLQQITSLKNSLSNKSEWALKEINTLQTKADAEIKRLEARNEQAKKEYKEEMERLKKISEEEKQQIENDKLISLKAIEAEFEQRVTERLSAQVEASQAALSEAKKEAENDKQSALHAKEADHKQTTEKLKIELSQRHMSEIDQISKAHKQQISAARMELERAVELKQMQDKENKLRLQEMQDDIKFRQTHIENMHTEVMELKNNIEELTRTLDFKGQEILKVKSNADAQLRKQEQQLQKSHQKELDNMEAEYLREKQGMLTEFNRAQELLKDKISALQIKLAEAEEKYNRRDSRPEDLEEIFRLKYKLTEQEQLMRKFEEEKRYFQMELVNRETNFNKVFNSSPNVGVINPLMKKKKGEKAPDRFVSAPNMGINGISGNNQRLVPLPDSPVHDVKLNPNRPLQDPRQIQMPRPPGKSKKFLNI
ncbi:protein FAM184A-like [Anneissia japonica]|uniref:protein FAM184A-like n=1 Tax=Anneissia japonica TaxID=1529436 RepID=UPI0014258923|nr:protein FAM184A-like [Anneissia japonica]